MKILHFSNEHLPDTRIERYLQIQKDLGYYVIFVGGKYLSNQLHPKFSFDELIYLYPGSKVELGLPFFYNEFKKKFYEIYIQKKPDIVHAHNLISAKICYDLKIPYIYDDHEFWRLQVAARMMEPQKHISKRFITNRYYKRFVNRWEIKVIKNAKAVISVSETIVEEHKKHNVNSFLIPNFPTLEETHEFLDNTAPGDKLKIVIMSKYSSPTEIQSVDKFIEVLSKEGADLTVIGKVPKKYDNITYVGYKPHNEAIKLLSGFHLGLYTIQEENLKIGFFKYFGPNRVFLYPHAGVMPVVHKDMIFLTKVLGNYAFSISKESDIIEIVRKLKNDADFLKNRPRETQEKARKDLLFNNYQDLVKQIYETVKVQ